MTTPTPDSRDKLQEDIENAREQLGDTVEALAHKVNVPARAKDSMHDAVAKVQGKAGELGDEATVLANKAVAKLPPQAQGRANQLVDGGHPPQRGVELELLYLLRNLRSQVHRGGCVTGADGVNAQAAIAPFHR